MEVTKAAVLEFVQNCYPEKGYGNVDNNNLAYLKSLLKLAKKLEVTDLNIQCSLFLSTVINDKKASYILLKSLFNSEIAEIVYLISDEKGKTLSEVFTNTFNNLIHNKEALLCFLIIFLHKIEMTIKSKHSNDSRYHLFYEIIKSHFHPKHKYYFIFLLIESKINSNYFNNK
jgi:hypothetical protein